MGEIYANPQATQTSLDDLFFNAEGWLNDEVAREFSEKEGNAFLLGNGTNKPKGLLAYTLDTKNDAERDFGFKAQYDLKQGIHEAIEWYKSAGWL